MTTVNTSSREAYQFAAEPRPVKSRSKYRGPEEIQSSNLDGIHYDHRIRNNNPMHSGERLGTKSSKKSIGGGSRAGIIVREEEPENLYGQLSDRTIQDERNLIPYYYVDRPATPEYRPMEPGVDVATQIDDLELFDYVLEVEPILQVLVGKTLVQAQTELREEDEKIEEMRQKMRFDKKRNAELMVTQRKEALHLRKQDEIARRNKQHIIEKEDKRILHQRYIARLLAKHTTHGILHHSINVLADQRLLCLNMDTELRRNYMPLLIQNTLGYVKANASLERNFEQWKDSIEKIYLTSHAASVKAEFDRLKKIADDAEAERLRLEAERKHRRERRRKLRLFVAKEAFLERVQNVVQSKSVEVENPFVAEVTDIFPTGKESVATIGGLIGELWLILETLQKESPYHLSSGQMVEILVKLLNEKYQYSQFPINLLAQYQPVIDETLQAMANDLIDFNANKPVKIQELMNELHEVNLLQNLSVLSRENLLDSNLLRSINKALISIFFTSVDYKIPEKKPKEEPPVPVEGAAEGESPAPAEGQDNSPSGKSEEKPAGEEVSPQGSDKILDALEEADKPIEPQEEEEEFKLPEVTALELAMVEAKKKLRLNYVNDWEYRRECDGIVRWRIGLNRKVEEEVVEVKEGEGEVKEGEIEGEAEVKKVEKEEEKVEVAAPEVEVEDRETWLRRMIENDDFIEPFDGTTYEKDKLEFPEKEMTSKQEEGGVVVAQPLKIYNTSLLEGNYVAQINERGQQDLRRGILGLVKEIVPEWRNANDEETLNNAYNKYKKNEKVILETLIHDPEQIPVFDVENL